MRTFLVSAAILLIQDQGIAISGLFAGAFIVSWLIAVFQDLVEVAMCSTAKGNKA